MFCCCLHQHTTWHITTYSTSKPTTAFQFAGWAYVADKIINVVIVLQQRQQQQQLFYGPLSRTTWVSRYQKKHSPTHHPDHHPIFISFFHLPWSMASFPFKLRALQSFAQPLSISSLVYLLVWSSPPHIQHISSPNQCLLFCGTSPYHRNLFCCSISIISSIPSLSLNSLLGTLSVTLTLHIHLTILISACWSATSFSFLTGQVSLPCSILLRTQLLYNLPLLINDIAIL